MRRFTQPLPETAIRQRHIKQVSAFMLQDEVGEKLFCVLLTFNMMRVRFGAVVSKNWQASQVYVYK